ncbi:MAG: alpha/beta hydrolase [Deltaproteobacteria bacterium]|nr:alpha/beta hydrolase [Deltaproteobacteria bacterium]
MSPAVRAPHRICHGVDDVECEAAGRRGSLPGMLPGLMVEPIHSDAVPPLRQRWLAAGDVRLRLHEWGDPEATPVVLCHGFFDHARGFDRLAPRLASRYRVVALDARGHGDSDWADTYMWPVDVLDIVRVLRDLGRPAHLIGHSKGGGQATDAATLEPDRVRGLVNLDGFGPPDDQGFKRPGAPDQSQMTIAQRCGEYLDRRRKADQRTVWPAYPSFEDLVARRGEQNPGLDSEWLRYFVYHAARAHDDGWRWKADPQMVAGGFGPFKPEWIGPSWQQLRSPMLAVIGSKPDTWGPLPEKLLQRRLKYVQHLERVTIEGAGHFIHMQEPESLADHVLEFLGRA